MLPSGRWLVVLAVLALAGGIFALGRWSKRPKPVPVLPPETVVVREVKEIEVPVEVIREVPGPVQIVEKVEFITKTELVEGPERIREVVQVVEKAQDIGSLQARVSLRASKFHGWTERTKTLAWGWRGVGDCEIRAADGDKWTLLASQPFDLSASTAITTARTDDPRRSRRSARLGLTSAPGLDASFSLHRGLLGWYVGAQYDLDPDEVRTFDFSLEREQISRLDRWRVYGGLSINW